MKRFESWRTAAMKIALVTALALIAVGTFLTVGVPIAPVGCGSSCNCPGVPSPPKGYCQILGGPCNCYVGDALCPGWCALVDGGTATPCDVGADE